MTGPQPRASAPSFARPAAIAAAGPAAGEAWDHLTRGGGYRRRTRAAYAGVAARFLTWLDARGLALAQVTWGLAEEFLGGLVVAPITRGQYRTALRRLFDALAVRDAIPNTHAATPPFSDEPATGAGRTTREQLKDHVRELALDPIEEGDEDFHAALVLLAAVRLGTRRVMPISRLTGVRPREVAGFARALRANGVWTADGKTACCWDDEEHGRLAFWLDVWVAQGLLERAPDAGPAQPGEGVS